MTDPRNGPDSQRWSLRIALLYAAFATLWIVLSGLLLKTAIADPVALWRFELVKGLAFVAVTSMVLYLLLRQGKARPLPVAELETLPSGRGILLVIAVILFAVPLAGYGILRLYGPQFEKNVFSELRAVSALKAEQINWWRNERLADTASLALSRDFVRDVRHNLAAPASQQHLLDHLQTIRTAYNYSATMVLAKDYSTLATTGEPVVLTGDSLRLLDAIAREGRAGHGDLFLDARGEPRMDFVAPLYAEDDGGRPFAFVLLRVDPRTSLFPLIHSWPAKGTSGETVVARRDRDSITFLGLSTDGGSSRFQHKLPLDTPDLVAGIALREGKAGTVQARDYRLLPVFAAYEPIPGTAWMMITKVDREEALAPLRELTGWISLAILVTAIVLSSILLMLWQQQRRGYQLLLLAQGAEHEKLLRERDAIYREMFEANPHPMWVYDLETLRFLAVNDAAIRHYGYSRDEFLGMTIRDIRPEEDVPRLLDHIASQRAGEMDSAGVWRHRRRDGTLIDVEITSHPLRFEGRPAETVLVYDLTERIRLETGLRESDRFAKSTIDALGLNIAVLDEQGVIITTNRNWREFSIANGGDPALTGEGANYLETCQRAAASGDPDAAALLAGLEQVIAGERISFSHEYSCHSPHEKRWFLVAVSRFEGSGPLRIVVSHETITARKEAELELRKLNRYYAALSRMNAAIIRTEESARLLEEVCRIAAELGELELVWIARLGGDGRFALVASDGPAEGFIAALDFTEDVTGSSVPGYRALREQHTLVVDDCLAEPLTRDWAAVMNKWNLRSMLVCPILRRDDASMVITFHAGQNGYFTEDLVRLLEELTADLAFGLDNLESEQKRIETEGRLLLNARVIESSHEGIFITNHRNVITMANRAMCEITGYSQDELLGQEPKLLKSGQQDTAFYAQLWQELAATGRWEGEMWDRRKNGEVFPAWLAITRVHDQAQGNDWHIAIYRDITERKEYERRIEHIANHDPLTDLPNRVLLNDRITLAIARSKRTGTQLAVLFVDLDRFKLVNDTLGHEAGDGLLKEMAGRIVACLRSSDTASRVGGDEFVLLLDGISSGEDAALVARKIIDAISTPCNIRGHELVVTASIGIALCPGDGEDAAGLMRLADTAMMAAKQGGHNRYHFYSGEMGANAMEYLEIQRELRNALARREIYLAYQPQFSLVSGEVTGMEALARWRHPRLGLVPPSRFIPIAEDSGMIVEIGFWIMGEACRQAQHWRARGIIDVPVSVNVSALQFRQDNFVASVKKALAESHLPPANLEVELTESMLMANINQAVEKLNDLHHIGVELAIDDFGTGYSSLSYLRQLPARRLKIDISFIRDLPEDQDAAAIASAIVNMGSTLGMNTIAEGVETEEQAAYLRTIHCQQAQGYLYAAPLAPADFENWLADWRKARR